jgi:uncharacterized protein (DUF1697 family)
VDRPPRSAADRIHPEGAATGRGQCARTMIACEMRHVVLVRGINVGSRNRVPMQHLRDALKRTGFSQISTYLQSGNIILSSDAGALEVSARCERLIEDVYGFNVAVITRTEPDLAVVVALNPMCDIAIDPKRYQVTFLSGEPDPETLQRLASVVVEPERFLAVGREIYAWHPNGIAGSKLALRLAAPAPGLIATARNWTTVTKLLELARG